MERDDLQPGSEQAGGPVDGTTEAAPSALVGVILDQRYLLEARIGAGGVGEVYRARHTRMERGFAVKVLPPTMLARPDFLGRFDREAQALSRLNHPCCVSVTDYGISDEHGPYIVMEIVDGAPLSAFTRGRGVTLDTALDLMIGVLAGLEHAHGQGIVHRDIKPDNIMVVARPLDPGRFMPKILDFGLAKFLAGTGANPGEGLTASGFVIGTPHYIAPERITCPAAADDPRADIYAAGVVLYELCCGRRPFEHDDLLNVIQMHLSLPPPPPRHERPALPAALERAILRALEKRPEDRFPSAAAFREALEALRPLPASVAELRPSETAAVAASGTIPPLVAGGLPAPALRLEPAPGLAQLLHGWTRALVGWARALPPRARLSWARALLLPRWRLVAAGVAAGVLPLVALTVIIALVGRGPAAPKSVAATRAVAAAAAPARAEPPPPAPASGGSRSAAAPASAPGPAATPARRGTSAVSEPGAELRALEAAWCNARARGRAGRQLMGYLARHPDDAAAHVRVGRLFLLAFWTGDGLRLVRRGLRADPTLRLDFETLVAIAFAYRGGTQGQARRLLDAHAGAEAGRVLLVAAALIRDLRIERRLLAEAQRRGALTDPLDQRLLDLVRARTCEERRVAVRALGAPEATSVRTLLAFLTSNECLAGEAKRLLEQAAR